MLVIFGTYFYKHFPETAVELNGSESIVLMQTVTSYERYYGKSVSGRLLEHFLKNFSLLVVFQFTVEV